MKNYYNAMQKQFSHLNKKSYLIEIKSLVHVHQSYLSFLLFYFGFGDILPISILEVTFTIYF